VDNAGAANDPFRAAAAAGVRFTLDDKPLDGGSDEVRRAIDAFNAGRRNRELDELQALNPLQLAFDEVLAFVAKLPSLAASARERVTGKPIDLASRELRLYSADGFGKQGFAKPWKLEGEAGALKVTHELDPDDVADDLARAAAAEPERQKAYDAAVKKLKKTKQGKPDYPPAFQAEAVARMRLVWLQRARIAQTELMLRCLPSENFRGLARKKLEAELLRLKKAVEGAPLGGGAGMPV